MGVNVRSDNDPGFVAEALRRRVTAAGARTAFIEPGSPWETRMQPFIDTLRASMRDCPTSS